MLAIVPWPLKISAEFQVTPLHNADIHAATSGLVEAVYVREGQEVKKGQLLARLRDTELRAEIAKLENWWQRKTPGCGCLRQARAASSSN